jgi:hypothetical protein
MTWTQFYNDCTNEELLHYWHQVWQTLLHVADDNHPAHNRLVDQAARLELLLEERNDNQTTSSLTQ